MATPPAPNPPPPPPQPPRRPTHNSLYKPAVIKPRKVTGGVRLAPSMPPFAWAGQRWMRVIEAAAPKASMDQGLEYARIAQTRRIDVHPGKVVASVQGRSVRAYDTTIHVQPFSSEQQEQVIRVLCDQAAYAAKLLAGDLPTNIEEPLTAAGLALFPTQPGEFKVQCTCREHDAKPWCHHAVCVGLLTAERFASDAFLMFTLRGLAKDDLMERLRQRRALLGLSLGTALVYAPPVLGVSDRQATPLQESIADYWESSEHVLDRPGLGEPVGTATHDAVSPTNGGMAGGEGGGVGGFDLPIAPPAISHPLLRRLGPSPFAPPTGTAKFPLVGLLATCYDLISEAAIRGSTREPSDEAAEGESGGQPTSA